MANETYSSGEILTAANLNRDIIHVVTSATRPSAPAEGWKIYETDTNKALIYDGSSWVPVAYLGAWDTYTPTWDATSSSPSIGNGTIEGHYMDLGLLGHVHVRLVMGSSTTYGSGTYSVTLPSGWTTAHTNMNVGNYAAHDNGAGTVYVGWVRTVVDQQAPVIGAISNSSFVTPTVPFTWAQDDIWDLSMTFHRAS